MTSNKTTVALRVLTALKKHTQPADADLLLLYLYCPDNDHLDSEELALLAIQQSVKESKQLSRAAASGWFG